MTAPKYRATPAGRRFVLEAELEEVRSALEPAEKVLEELRDRRNAAIRELGRLPEDHRPTSTELSKVAGVSRQYVVRLWEE